MVFNMSNGSPWSPNRTRRSRRNQHRLGEARRAVAAAAPVLGQVSGLPGSDGGRSERDSEGECFRRELLRRSCTIGPTGIPCTDTRYRAALASSRDIIGPANERRAFANDLADWVSHVVPRNGRRLPVYQDEDWCPSHGSGVE